jgi:uncharacterized protein (UPF0305 family)
MFKVQSHEKRTISWWYSKKDKIDFTPEYQRKGNVWGDKDKAYLIDSILNEYDIPKLYLADFNILNTDLNEKNKPYAVVDGRQRLEAIFQFYEGKIRLNSDFQYFNDPTINLANKSYSELYIEHPEIADIFLQYNLDVMSVITNDVSKIRDLFLRLNRSVNLTGAELRNAMGGIVPELIRGICDRGFFKKVIRFNTSRGQDKNLAAKLMLIELNENFVDTKKINLDKMVKDAINDDNLDIYYSAANRVANQLDDIEKVFDGTEGVFRNYGAIPLYFNLIRREGLNPDVIDFLIGYNKVLRMNSRKHAGEVNNSAKLLYDTAVRNINDGKSLRVAYGIIDSSFQHFKSTRRIEFIVPPDVSLVTLFPLSR